MYIIYDARHFEDYISGLSRYSHSVLVSLIKLNEFEKLEVILNSNYDYTSNPLYISLNKILNNKIIIKYLKADIFSIKQNFEVSRYVNESGCDLYFYPHFDLPLFIKKKSIFVVHDLFPIILKDYIQKISFLKRIYFKMMIYINIKKNNTSCICVSNNTKSDIEKFITNKYSKKLHVIYEDSLIETVENEHVRDSFNQLFSEKYLFYIGARRRHKNIKLMIDIFNKMIQKKLYDGYFYIAGSEKNFDFNIDEYVKGNDRIKLIGKINDKELQCFYKKMDSLFFLSKYEGFGLPIVEASKLNKKIITSDSGSCPEVLPQTGLSLNINLTSEDLYIDVVKYLNDSNYIDNKEFNEKFDWSNTSNFIIGKAKNLCVEY